MLLIALSYRVKDKADLVAIAKRYATTDPRAIDLLAKYPDILNQRARQGTLTEGGIEYHTITFRKNNPRGASQYFQVQINLDMTLRGFRKYKIGH